MIINKIRKARRPTKRVLLATRGPRPTGWETLLYVECMEWGHVISSFHPLCIYLISILTHLFLFLSCSSLTIVCPCIFAFLQEKLKKGSFFLKMGNLHWDDLSHKVPLLAAWYPTKLKLQLMTDDWSLFVWRRMKPFELWSSLLFLATENTSKAAQMIRELFTFNVSMYYRNIEPFFDWGRDKF